MFSGLVPANAVGNSGGHLLGRGPRDRTAATPWRMLTYSRVDAALCAQVPSPPPIHNTPLSAVGYGCFSPPSVAWSRAVDTRRTHACTRERELCHSLSKLNPHRAPGHHQSRHAQDCTTGEHCIALGLPLTPTT